MGGCNINTSFTDYARKKQSVFVRFTSEKADLVTWEGCPAEQQNSEVISPGSD